MKVLAFDIGIKNLAWALIDNSCCPYEVIGLANENIMSELETGTENVIMMQECHHENCKLKASWNCADNYQYCKRHVPKEYCFLENKENPNQSFHKIPIKYLKTLLNDDEKQIIKKTPKIKRSGILDILIKRYAFPIERPKKRKVSHVGLEELHDLIRNFVKKNIEVFSKADVILLENQPAFKNPHMKTVQILLFSSLRESLYQISLLKTKIASCLLVHAKKKVSDAPAGDTGYAERKIKSEERIVELYRNGTLRGHELVFSNAKKKSDMADALCMCCDYK